MGTRYYSRSVDRPLNNKKDTRKLKGWFIPVLLAFVASAAAAAEMVGVGITVIMLPAIVFMVMFLGALAPRETISALWVYAAVTPIVTGISLGQDMLGVIVTALCLFIGATVSIPYRPFLWKNSAASPALAVFIIFLNLAVTNTAYTVTLVMTLIIKSAVTWVLCMGAIQGARLLLRNGRFLQWVLKQD